MQLQVQIPPIVRDIHGRVKRSGGRALLVGGAVVDAISGSTPKDWDIEVFGLGYEELCVMFADLGPKQVGKSFGIVKLSADKCDGEDIDINVPRRDNSVGIGHTDFECVLDPSMSSKEAARRRDFSINSMAMDLETMDLVDPFGGYADLEAGILRATDPVTFVEDPLRALRAMQLLPRKAKEMDAHTMALIRSMVDTFPNLAAERVHEEFRKLLMKSERPSVGLEFLRESGWLVHFPELHALIGCEQHPEWHPEGDVWIHTLHVTDSAAWARDKVDPEWAEAFMFGTMLHDVGKPEMTVTPERVASGEFPKERLFTAYGHDQAGVAPAEVFMRRMTNIKKLIERTSTIVGEHMQPYNLFQGGARNAGWKRLHNRIRLDIIGWMSRCDCCGRPDVGIGEPDFEHDVSEHCFSRFADLGAEPIQPVIQGRDLIAAGYKPGSHFGGALRAAFDAQMEDGSASPDLLMQRAVKHLVASGYGKKG
jgi:tRNA nucleotidyltransferase (CCA-adding enzyme)